MTAIKPPSGSGPGPGSSGPIPAIHEANKGAASPDATAFQEHIAETQTVSRNSALRASGTDTATSQSIIADLRSGKIAPADALHQLTNLAVQQSGAPVAMRPVIETRLRDLLARDPLIQDLVRQMGIMAASDK